MTDHRAGIRTALNALLTADRGELSALAEAYLTEDVVWDVAAPVGRLVGRAAVVEGFFLPLRTGLSHVRRRDEIFIGGPNRRDYGGDWVAAVTHYVGTYNQPLFGMPCGEWLAFLRSGEFYRVLDGRIAEAKILPDFADLLRQARLMPHGLSLGTEMLFPGPATHDGVLPTEGDGERTLDIIDGMIGDLHIYDPETFGSRAQTGPGGYWHPDMLWYGPAGIGSNYRWSGFVEHHRAPFLIAFPDRHGGNHYCRIGDGNYAAISGWPSMTMTHAGPYLGVPATGRSLSLNVMDFYRCAEGQIMENWVFLDYLDLFQQMGVDLIERARAAA